MIKNIQQRPNLQLSILILCLQQVTGYENAYDMMDRAGSSIPRRRFFEESEQIYNRDRYTTNNRNPFSVYMNIRPNDSKFRFRTSQNGFGNGYDNVGNGYFSSNEYFRSEPNFSTGPRSSDIFESHRYDEPRRFSDEEGFESFHNSDIKSHGHSQIDNRDDSWFDRRRTRINPHIDERTKPFKESFHGPTKSFEERRRIPDVDKESNDNFQSYRRRNYPPFHRRDYFVTKPPAKVSSGGFETEKSDKNYQTAGGEKGSSSLASVGSFVSSNEDENQKKVDSGFEENKEGAKVDVENKEKVGETTRIDKNGGNKSTVRSNKVVKKGHSTKGFATHHHKDETGNSTTFFDESSDQGGQSDYKDLEDEFGTRRTMEILNGKEDGRFFRENGGHRGNFGSGFLRDNKKTEQDIVTKDDRFNNGETYGSGQDHSDRGFKATSDYLGGGIWGDHGGFS